MPRVTAERVQHSKRQLLDAARDVLTAEGFAGLSTRRVAEAAGTQMSQIQYHFGSKEGMILALFEDMNAKLVERQMAAFEDSRLSVSQKWQLACDYLDQDLASGYVRVLQELIAAGWANEPIRKAVRAALEQWHVLLKRLARDAMSSSRIQTPFSAESLAALIASAFLGAEALLLLGYEDRAHPVRKSLRQVGDILAAMEGKRAKE